MTIYIALIRGINVGGKNKVPMAELRSAYEALGLNRVQTYIQSGNVLFESEESADALRPKLEQAIVDKFGIEATVAIRSAREWERIIADCPYGKEPLLEGENIQVTVLTEPPAPKALEAMEGSKGGIDEFYVRGLEIYSLFRQSILDSKLAKSLVKLGTTATSRNMNTMNKLAELAKKMA
ncbi:DUF1697 domain-containing protein [Cohnella cholangitidis]|uniref:DUF1697 domain-containing protein n=1 Tax=Cohnella cholangitidis TaxID=2598458 RepID=A0A7G5C251_9BACL|nr:DUF1697 domain-containing protein [Cohnella cholangitidis]QMV43285.1 DUF1697 domain-containing protein [Cohnella cholangitidis]